MANSLEAAKSELVDLAHQRMERAIADNAWTDRQKLALTCRILFDGGHDSGLAGQITCRTGTPGRYYTQQLGLGFDEITEANLLEVDEDLNVIEGAGMANPANRFHTWIYRHRSDVNCIVHTHPTHVAALSMLETPLVVSHMDTCPLYDECAFLPKWPGIPVGNEEGEMITRALGDKRAVLLAHRHARIVGSVSTCPAGHVHTGGEQHVALEMDQAEMAARADVDLLVDDRSRLREDGPELDCRGRMTAGQRARQEGATQVLPEHARNDRQRLRRAGQRPIAAQHARADEERGERRRDDHGRHAESERLQDRSVGAHQACSRANAGPPGEWTRRS